MINKEPVTAATEPGGPRYYRLGAGRIEEEGQDMPSFPYAAAAQR